MVRAPLFFWWSKYMYSGSARISGNLHRLAFDQRATHDAAASGGQRNGPDKFKIIHWEAVTRGVIERRTPRSHNGGHIGLAKVVPPTSISVSSTACRSKVERLMTLSTSAVAVCCCRDFAQLVEQPSVLDGDDGLSGEIRDQLDLLCR